MLQTGSAWAKTEEVEGRKVLKNISIQLDEVVLTMYPQLRGLRHILKPIPQEQRKKENSPNYRLLSFKPQPQKVTEEQTAETTEDYTEQIPF